MSSPVSSIPTGETQNSTAVSPSGAGRCRFTIDGSEELEDSLADLCQRISGEIHDAIPPNRLDGILLGGGYGRGEGGVLKTSRGDRAYNDFESYIFLRGNVWLNERRYAAALEGISTRLSSFTGIHVEFKLSCLAKLRRSAIDMFTYDLVAGHRWILGHEGLLAGCEHHRAAQQIPLSEATRLLMNRLSGLLFADEALDRATLTPDSRDFVVRNLAKVKLALGDAVLTVFGQYHWSCLERRRRLEKLAPTEQLRWLDTVKKHHATGVEFKLHPHLVVKTATELIQESNELRSLGLLVWLWLEQRRLGHPFVSAREYAMIPIDKCPETHSWRNRLVNAEVFGPRQFFRADAARSPRHRLLNALALLVWECERLEDPELSHFLQRELGCSQTELSEPIHAYRSLWSRFN